MRSWVVDPATKQRYLLVSTAGAPALMAAEQEMLYLRNDLAIMQALQSKERSAGQDALKEQLDQTKARVAVLEAELSKRDKAA